MRVCNIVFSLMILVSVCDFYAVAGEIDAAGDSLPSAESARSSENSVSIDTPVPVLVHPAIGESVRFDEDKQIKLVDKLRNYPGANSGKRDPDIYSPKSVNIHPHGCKFYVNSLEGGKTVVYSLPELEKLAVISHNLDSSHSDLWASPSGLFKFRHYSKDLNTFVGKPVESIFSHGGRYLWIPYYRRSFDLNAQDPSAMAVIDTSSDTIVRIMEAGVLPKMVALSPDGTTVAVAHWGDNTVGLIDVTSGNPEDWSYVANIPVGKQLFHDYSLSVAVDRDKNTGEALRGSVFTPDSRYLLVGCMSGGGVAVIDVERKKYLGKLYGMMPNVRHIVIKGDWLYVSINIAGYVQRVSLSDIMKGIAVLEGGERNVTVSDWQSVKVDAGARTLDISPSGDYIFVACNTDSRVCIVDSSMRKIAKIPVDSYPVGLDVSSDGQWMITTSQGRKGYGGNCVDVYKLEGLSRYVFPETIEESEIDSSEDAVSEDNPESVPHSIAFSLTDIRNWLLVFFGGLCYLLSMAA